MTTSPFRNAHLHLVFYIALLSTIACGPEPIVGPPGTQDEPDLMQDEDANKEPFMPGGNQIPWPDMNRLMRDQGTPPGPDMPADLDMPAPDDLGSSQDLGTQQDQGTPAQDMPTSEVDMPATMVDMPPAINPPECAPWPLQDLSGVSIADVTSSYSPATWESSLLTMMSRRYPEGYNLLQAGRSLGGMDDCILQYEGFMDTSTLGLLALDLGITLRSCGYVFNNYDASTRNHELYRYNPVTGGLDIQSFTIPASWPTRGAVKPYLGAGFEQDASVLNHLTRQDDLGAPMSMILDEMQLYTEELISGYVLREVLSTQFSISRREPVRMHQLWVLIYLHHMRTTQPAEYAQLINDQNLRTHILWIWARSEFILSASASVQGLGIGQEAPIINAIADPRWSQEIATLRATHGCR